MNNLTDEEMYDEFGFKRDYEIITCDSCNTMIGFSFGNIEAVTETISFLCKKCLERLP